MGLSKLDIEKHMIEHEILKTPSANDVWLKYISQTGLTGDKTGSFDLTTTGNVGIETIIPLTKLQVGIDNVGEPVTLGTLTPKTIIMGAENNNTEDSLLRLIRPTDSGNQYPASVDFKVSSYGLGGPPTYSPETQLTIGLKASNSYDSGDVADVITLKDNGDVSIAGLMTSEEALINVGAGTNYLDISELNLNSFKGPYMVGRGDFGVRVIFIEGGNRLTTQIVNACDYGWYSRDNAKGHWNMEYTSSTDKLVLKKSTTTNNILWNEAIDYNFEDDYGVYFGTDSDAKVYYDGTDLIIDPKAVGSGKVNIDSDLNVSGNFTGNQIYGGMWYHNHTATQLNFAVDGTYYNMFMSNATHLNGFSYQGGFNQLSNLTAQIGGVYKVDYMSSGDGQNNHAYYTSVFINGVNQDNCESHHKMSAGGDIITQSGNCFIELDVSDVVEVKTANIGHSGTGNYYSANLNVVRMGD